MKSTKTILSRILFLIYLAAIAFLCFMRVDTMPEIQKDLFGIPTDKIAHFIMFLPFPILAFLSFDHTTRKAWGAVLFALVTFVAGAAIAYGTEYVQGFLPYRSKDMSDFRADLLALVISTIGAFLIDVSNLKKRN